MATLRDALAPDVALNLPAVLDRSALLDVLSVLITNSVTATVTAPPVRPPWKQLRLARGWSQSELFRRLQKVAADGGVRLPDWPTFKRNLCRWENGAVAVSPFYAQLLARVFDLSSADGSGRLRAVA